MAYKAIVTKIKNVRTHPNADRVKLATCHGNQVVVGLNTQEDEWGVYFPSDGQLSEDFCYNNNLYRDITKNKDANDKPGMFEDNRRVRVQKFRGEKSDGFWVPLSYFSYIQTKGLDVEGYEFDEWCGKPICNKYINPATLKAAQQTQGKKTRTAKTSVMFKEHYDTAHFGRNLAEIKADDLIIITEKAHGTSHRVGHVIMEREMTWIEKLLCKFGVKIDNTKWSYLNGTRRVVLEETTGQGFHDPTIREIAFKTFNGNLRKGETVYLEIVGFEPTGASIMPSVDTTKLNDKQFTKRYANAGDNVHMNYSYGCALNTCDIYVYRMTLTNIDGQSVDYSWDDVKRRCAEIGVKHVPEMARFTVSEYRAKFNLVDDRDFNDHIEKYVDELSNGASLIDQSHIKEGVCVRLESGLTPRVFKHKSFNFKVLEDIIKEAGVVDMEEAN